MSPKINIFCPVETINRELDYRLFFAALAVRPDLRFIIGRHWDVSSVLELVGGGLYLGQNVRPVLRTQLKPALKNRLIALRARGTTLMVLDEEGGIMAGDESRWKQWLDFRVDIKAFEPQEHLCTWGDWQREHYKAAGALSPEHIHVTGHPRFDLYKERFRSFYDDEVADWKNRFGNFVLVNTNFAWANHFRGEGFVFGDNPVYKSDDAKQRLDFLRQWSHVSQVRAKMVALVMHLSVELPQLHFVIRAHPSEDEASYRTLFHDAPNVHVCREGSVGSWLLASRALIHDGCTTAVEAHFCGVPILNYKAVHDSRYDLMLPNSLGERCESEERVLDCLQAIVGGDTKRGQTPSVPPMAQELIFNFEGDAFEALTQTVHNAVENVRVTDVPFETAFGRYARRELSRAVRQKLKPKSSGVQASVQASQEKFYGFQHVDLARKFEKVQRVLNKDVRFSLLSNRVLTVEC